MNKTQKLEKLIGIAKSLIGTPFKYGATVKQAPKLFDCSSFVQYLFKRVGIKLPRDSILQATFGKRVPLNKLEPGDLLFARGTRGYYNDNFFPKENMQIGHVMLYIGENKVIHATKPKIKMQDITKLKPCHKIVLAKRII